MEIRRLFCSATLDYFIKPLNEVRSHLWDNPGNGRKHLAALQAIEDRMTVMSLENDTIIQSLYGNKRKPKDGPHPMDAWNDKALKAAKDYYTSWIHKNAWGLSDEQEHMLCHPFDATPKSLSERPSVDESLQWVRQQQQHAVAYRMYVQFCLHACQWEEDHPMKRDLRLLAHNVFDRKADYYRQKEIELILIEGDPLKVQSLRESVASQWKSQHLTQELNDHTDWSIIDQHVRNIATPNANSFEL